MSWRIRVEHRSVYRYAGDVRSSYNEARITPMTTPDQTVLEANVSVVPHVPCLRYWDYWGSVVHAFDVHVPHRQLEVTGRSLVETDSRPWQEPSGEASWEDLDRKGGDELAEYLVPSDVVPAVPELATVAAALRRQARPADAVARALEWVRERLEYVPGSTAVHTSAVEALEGGRGVCQDFAHVTLGLLRAAGIPARYCSGYVHPGGDTEPGTTAVGQSHAWVEHWTGDWVGVDPTVGAAVGPGHVLVARGRDYGDVSPLRGIYHGERTESLEVSVTFSRLA